MKTPNMTKEQKAELKELQLRKRNIAKERRKVAMSVTVAVAHEQRELDKALAKLQRDYKATKVSAERRMKELDRQTARLFKGLDLSITAVNRRLEIVTGRLS